MAVTNFIPEVWSSKFLVRLRKAHVFGGIVNRDYEGEIREFGDSVKINEVGPITVSNYTQHSEISFETLNSAQKTLLIDQAKFFAFKIDDIEEAQTKPKLMNAAMEEAAFSVSDVIDQFLASKYTEAGVLDATNLGTATTAISILSSTGNAFTILSKASQRLTESNVPQQGRWMVIPPWFHNKLMNAAAGTGSGLTTSTVKDMGGGILVDGWVGKLWGFDLFISNNVAVPTGSTYAVMFGNRQAISYAGQIAKIAATDIEKGFGQGVKGLYVYGGKVVRPEALGVAYVSEGA